MDLDRLELEIFNSTLTAKKQTELLLAISRLRQFIIRRKWRHERYRIQTNINGRLNRETNRSGDETGNDNIEGGWNAP